VVAALAPGAVGWSLEPWRESTYEEAGRWAAQRLGGLDGRRLAVESAAERPGLDEVASTGGAVLVAVPRLADLDEGRLDRADVEVFPRARLAAGDPFYLRRAVRVDASQVGSAAPRGLLLRGPELVVVLHPWRGELALRLPLVGSPAGGGRHLIEPPTPAPRELPEKAAGETTGDGGGKATAPAGKLLSITVVASRRWRTPHRIGLEVGARDLPLWTVGRAGESWVYASERWPAAGATGAEGEIELVLPAPAGSADRFEVELWRWTPG
jgi:hypothetical protein